jgi:hypothetical protein
VTAGEWLRRNRARLETDAAHANVAAIKRERDAIVVKLRTVEQEAAELRTGIAAADARRFADAELRFDATQSRSEVAAKASMAEVLAAAEATERSMLRIRDWAARLRARGAVPTEHGGRTSAEVSGELEALRETLRVRDEDFAIVLDRLHTFETDWFREHTAAMDAQQRIVELEARLAGLERPISTGA